MRFRLTILFAWIFVVNSSLSAQDEVFSGPQPGEAIKPFQVLQVNSPTEVEEIEIGNEQGPVLICFMHKLTEPALGLFINLEFFCSDHEQLNHHYVMLTDDRAKTEQQLKRWAERKFFKTAPMSLSPDGPEGPGEYGLNRNIVATILIAQDNKVIRNFAFQDPNQGDTQVILNAIAETIGQPAPDFEEIRKEMRKQRDMRRRMQMQQNPVYKLAPNERLAQIMWRMLHTEGDREGNARQRSGEFREWAGDNREKLAALRIYCQAILDGDFELNEFSKKALQELAKDE